MVTRQTRKLTGCCWLVYFVVLSLLFISWQVFACACATQVFIADTPATIRERRLFSTCGVAATVRELLLIENGFRLSEYGILDPPKNIVGTLHPPKNIVGTRAPLAPLPALICLCKDFFWNTSGRLHRRIPLYTVYNHAWRCGGNIFSWRCL